MMDQEVSNPTSPSGSPMESLGLFLMFASGAIIAVQVWRLGSQKNLPRDQLMKKRKITAITISVLAAFLIVGIVSVPGQTLRFAIDSGEETRYVASEIAYDNEQKQLEIEEAQARAKEAQASASAAAAAEAESKTKESAAAVAASQSAQALVDEQLAFENSRNAKNGGFSTTQIKTLKSFSKLTFAYVDTYSGYVVGTDTIAAVAIMCSKLEEFYSGLTKVSSSAPYYEDLLDRAKDYYYEAKETCARGFKKNRIDEINESVQMAGTSYGFFDGILKKIEASK